MATRKNRVPAGKVQRSSKRRRRFAGETAAALPVPPDESEERFDEPTTAAQQPIVPVEEPVASPQRLEDTDACGLPDEATTPAPDLH